MDNHPIPIFYTNKKRYVLRFELFTDKVLSKSVTEYDNLEEAMEEIRLLNEFYCKTPKPMKERVGKYGHYTTNFSGDAKYWGYILLDYEDCKILKIGNDGLYGGINKREDPLKLMDYFFRKEGEVPPKYNWDIGEYKGWLQFRWGNGKNAIGYQEKTPKPEKINEIIYNPVDSIFEPEVTEDLVYEELEKHYDDILEKEMKQAKEFKW